MDFINGVSFTPSWRMYPFTHYSSGGQEKTYDYNFGVANNKFIALGGTSEDAIHFARYEFDLRTHASAVDFPDSSYLASGAGGGGYQNRYLIYAGGVTGMQANGTARTIQYDAVSRTFTRLSSLPKSQISARGAITTDRMYYMGGFSFEDETDIPAHRTFYINTNSWGRLVWFPREYKLLAMAGDHSQDRIVVVSNTETWNYDGNARQWSQGANCPWAFDRGAGSIYEGKAYFMGYGLTFIPIYNINTNTWSQGPALAAGEDVNYGAMDLWGSTLVGSGNGKNSLNLYTYNQYEPNVDSVKLARLKNVIALTPRRELQG